MSTIPIYANRELRRYIKVYIFSRNHKIARQVEVSFLINRKTRYKRFMRINRISYRKSNTLRMIYQSFREQQFPIWGELIHHYIAEANAKGITSFREINVIFSVSVAIHHQSIWIGIEPVIL